MHKFYLFGAGFKEEGAGRSQYAKQPCSQPHPEGQWDYTKPKHCKQAARCSPRNLQRDDFLQGKDVKQLFLNSSSGLQMLWDFCYGGLTLLDKPLTSFYLFLKLTHTNSICNRVCQFDWNQRYSNVNYQIYTNSNLKSSLVLNLIDQALCINEYLGKGHISESLITITPQGIGWVSGNKDVSESLATITNTSGDEGVRRCI